jgi:hypothetical protein
MPSTVKNEAEKQPSTQTKSQQTSTASSKKTGIVDGYLLSFTGMAASCAIVFVATLAALIMCNYLFLTFTQHYNFPI